MTQGENALTKEHGFALDCLSHEDQHDEVDAGEGCDGKVGQRPHALGGGNGTE